MKKIFVGLGIVLTIALLIVLGICISDYIKIKSASEDDCCQCGCSEGVCPDVCCSCVKTVILPTPF